MSLTSYIRDSADDFFNLFFPKVCASCERSLVKGEQVICMHCRFNELPQTGFHLMPGNLVERHFWGKIDFERAASFLLFTKDSKVQHLLHQLKYKGRKDVGEMLGRMYGAQLKEHFPFSHADLILPVPLHESKLRKRGFNQSDCIATGLSEAMEIPWRNDILFRNVSTETQTKKSRLERWQNVEDIFECENVSALLNKRILLVDDVLTTGATMEACAVALQKVSNVKVNFITIACASS